MSKYLIQTNEIYRTDTENEAKELIENSKNNSLYSLIKYSSEYKEVRKQGEVIDDYYKVTLHKYFTDIKEPEKNIDILYSGENYEYKTD